MKNRCAYASRVLFLSLIGCLAWSFTAWAQSSPDNVDTDSDTQFWTDYNPRYYLKNNLRLGGQLGFRTMLPEEWYRGVSDLNVNWTPKRIHERKLPANVFDIRLGASYFFTFNDKSNDIHEIRLHESLTVSWPNRTYFRLLHRLRFEQRFEDDNDSEDYQFSGRMRYRVGSNIMLKGHFWRNFYLPAFGEVFFSLGDGIQFNDVVRMHAGVGAYLGDALRMEGTVGYHNTNNTVAGVRKTHDLVFRLRVIHNIN